MSGEYDGSAPIRSDGGDLVPQVWDPTLNGGDGGWRVLLPSDLGSQSPLAAPSGNLPRTAVSSSAAQQVASGSCAYGFYLANDPDSADRLYYGAAGVDATHGDLLEPGERAWIPLSNSSGIWVLAAAAGCYYRGERY